MPGLCPICGSLATAFSRRYQLPTESGGRRTAPPALQIIQENQDVLGSVTDPLTGVRHDIVSDVDGLVVGGALPQVGLSGHGLFHIGGLASQ